MPIRIICVLFMLGLVEVSDGLGVQVLLDLRVEEREVVGRLELVVGRERRGRADRGGGRGAAAAVGVVAVDGALVAATGRGQARRGLLEMTRVTVLGVDGGRAHLFAAVVTRQGRVCVVALVVVVVVILLFFFGLVSVSLKFMQVRA